MSREMFEFMYRVFGKKFTIFHVAIYFPGTALMNINKMVVVHCSLNTVKMVETCNSEEDGQQ